MPSEQHPGPAETISAWLQTRAVLRILMLLLAVAGLLWIIYRLTTVILLIVLAVFFAYLVAPLVDLVQRPIHIGGRQWVIPRGMAIGIVYLLLFVGGGLAIYFLAPQLGAQFPEFKQQASAYSKSISGYSDRLTQY